MRILFRSRLLLPGAYQNKPIHTLKKMAGPIKVAVLDDYQGFAEPVFKKLDPRNFEVTIFRDTLLPYDHPDTPQDVKDKLVSRLEPFKVICTWHIPCPR